MTVVVTGQVVTVSYVTRVVVPSDTGVEAGTADDHEVDGTGIGVTEIPLSHAVQTVEVEVNVRVEIVLNTEVIEVPPDE